MKPTQSQARLTGLLLAILLAGGVSSCFGGGGSLSPVQVLTAGAFKVESTNIANGDIWALNRTIVLRFNHPVDPTTIGFGSIIIRPVSPAVSGQPVTGTFSLVSGTGSKEVLFRPACPTNATNTNGAFVPGGFEYELSLPTVGSFGTSILRDTGGHPLEVGLTRSFFTPTAPTEPLFIDTVPGPLVLTDVTFPAGLNLFTDPDPTIALQFNQALDGRASNLNLSNLFVVYSDNEIGAGTPTFCGSPVPLATCTNRVPGQLFLVENCSETGARVFFQVTGILPPNRTLQVVVLSTLRDIAGETNTQNQLSATHATPLLSQVYTQNGLADPSWNDNDVTIDEFRDDFETTLGIDPDAALQLPPAIVGGGVAQASFEFPGTFVGPDVDFFLDNNTFLEVDTSTQVVITDTNNRSFTVVNGVLNVDDFFIGAGSTLRGRGLNPLIIYATGTVELQGTLDVSGNNSHWPTGLNSPQFPEGGAHGECGGGDGGSASLKTASETVRGEDGFGAFGVAGSGGGGGEGGFQQHDGYGGPNNAVSLPYLIAAGAGGGSFALTPNRAIVWERWSGPEIPPDFDNSGPDHHEVTASGANGHPGYDDVKLDGNGRPYQGDIRHPIRGGEPGLRGSSRDSQQTGGPPTPANGMFGMEDLQTDDTVLNEDLVFDPPTTWVAGNSMQNEFEFGHPTRGPDPGFQGPSIFSNDGDTGDDFWGRRLNNDGTVTVGELNTPWAGSGGGASGDSQVITRIDLDGNGLDEPASLFWPSVPFPNGGSNLRYRKGAPGGGGGGQNLLMAVGPIIIGPDARLLAKGGIGHGGESIIFTYNQVSGSGGGSGGHLVLNSATGLDLSQISLGSLTTAGQVATYLADPEGSVPPHPLNLRALGGRRGWTGSRLTNPGPGSNRDGNGDFMIGRGGAGGDGVIQIHVPDPLLDISWHPSAEPGIIDYITNGTTTVLDVDRLEEVLGIFAVPTPYVLIPFFASGSQFQSKWIDIGLAGLRLPGGAPPGSFPDYAYPDDRLDGLDASGFLRSVGGTVDPLTPVLISLGTAPASAFEMVVPSAASVFNIMSDPVKAHFLRNPGLLVGFDLVSDPADASGFGIVSADYDRATDVLTLVTLSSDGPMTLATGVNWSIRKKYLNVVTTGQKDRLPPTATVRVEFQGTNESAPGSNQPDLGSIMPGPTSWYSDPADMALLKGKRFIRYRVTFDIDALGSGVTLGSERPGVTVFKLPFAW